MNKNTQYNWLEEFFDKNVPYPRKEEKLGHSDKFSIKLVTSDVQCCICGSNTKLMYNVMFLGKNTDKHICNNCIKDTNYNI